MVGIAIGAMLLYKHYKREEDMLDSRDHQAIVRDYLMGEKLDRGKPFLWVHASGEINARNLASQNTTDLNQPYMFVTMKSIADKCKSFNVCLVNDDSFRTLIPDWTTDLSELGNPLKERKRAEGMTSLLYYYGGMVVPASTLCFRDLISLYGGDFAVQLPNRGGFKADARFMGGKRRSEKLRQLLEVQRAATNATDFAGSVSDWLDANVQVVDGKRVGVKNVDGGRIEIQDLLGKTPLRVAADAIYIPADEILARPAYGWFVRLSPKEFMSSDIAISKLAVKAFT